MNTLCRITTPIRGQRIYNWATCHSNKARETAKASHAVVLDPCWTTTTTSCGGTVVRSPPALGWCWPTRDADSAWLSGMRIGPLCLVGCLGLRRQIREDNLSLNPWIGDFERSSAGL